MIYYDALLPDVALPAARGRLSGVGVALGYVGSIVSALLLGTTTDADGNITAASFLLIGSLFAIFAIPIFVIVRERQRQRGILQPGRGAALVVAAADHHRATRDSGPDCCASWSAASSTPTRSTPPSRS